MKRRKKNFRKRSCEEDEEEEEAVAGSDGADRSGENGGNDGVRMSSLQAVRAMQKMRGTKMYRETQIQVRRQAEEATTTATPGSTTTLDGRKIGLDTRDNPAAGQKQPVDITDHTQRMFVSPSVCPSLLTSFILVICVFLSTGKSISLVDCAMKERIRLV